jgi:hypothetical protein
MYLDNRHTREYYTPSTADEQSHDSQNVQINIIFRHVISITVLVKFPTYPLARFSDQTSIVGVARNPVSG